MKDKVKNSISNKEYYYAHQQELQAYKREYYRRNADAINARRRKVATVAAVISDVSVPLEFKDAAFELSF